tara:strand:- start:425 stop:1480 length:1056 start_codon:yes stop_codon:yes gene_type:complete
MSKKQDSITDFFKRNKVRFPWTAEGLNSFEHFSDCSLPESVKASKFYRRFKDRYLSPSHYKAWSQEIQRFACFGSPKFLEQNFYEQDGSIFPKNPDLGRFIGSTIYSYFYKPPTFYISKDMVDALENTVVPAMAEPEKVIHSFYLIMPEPYKGTRNGRSSWQSTILLAQTGEAHYKGLKIGNRLFNLAIENPSHGQHPLNNKNAGMHLFCADVDYKKEQLYFNYVEGFWDTEYKLNDGDPAWLINVIKNIVLLHNYDRKRFKTEEKPRQQTAGRGFRVDSLKAQYPITWIGKNYKRQKATQKPTDSNQAKRIFKSHWRKGHWHHFWAGQGRKQKILKWVQPVYVKGINLHS